jgi:polyisoprenoid-binding protein YceI
VYRLDAQASTVWILVGKTGPLAAFGHRHIISVGRLYGFVRLDTTGTGQADLRFPVAALVVDTAAAEKRYHHYSRPTAKDIAGTRAHMLGPGVLDSAHYPWVSLHIRTTIGETSRVLTATITLHGTQRILEIANHFTHRGSHLSAQGEFSIKQSNFNITPYAILLGALQVKDTIRIRYHLIFNAWCPTLPPAKAPTC